MHISEWIKNGCPENIWFTIIRHEDLEYANKNTPFLLMNLIKLCLQNYGDFEIRRLQPLFLEEYWTFEDQFIVDHAIGNINGKEVPVIAVSVEARITKMAKEENCLRGSMEMVK